jgi:hypothetical protein
MRGGVMRMKDIGTVKLKDIKDLTKLTEYGFIEDPANCEVGDHYYHSNNYYLWVNGDFRITVNTHDGHVDVLCLADESGLYTMFYLKPLYDLFASGLIEIQNI